VELALAFEQLFSPFLPARLLATSSISHQTSDTLRQLELPHSLCMFAAGVAAANAAAAADASTDAAAPAKPRFWRPGTIAPGSNVEREVSSSGEDAMMMPLSGSEATSRLSIRQQRMLLPIAGHRRQILYALERHQVLVLVGATGCGSVKQAAAAAAAAAAAVKCTSVRRRCCVAYTFRDACFSSQ
jgi:HrpA-like RNA helicase